MLAPRSADAQLTILWGSTCANVSSALQTRTWKTYPLVKTFSNDVFPHAPSPLEMAVSAVRYVASLAPLHLVSRGKGDVQEH